MYTLPALCSTAINQSDIIFIHYYRSRQVDAGDGDELTANVGRPVISLDMYEVEFLRSVGLTWTDVARCLGVSRSTLYRRMDESGLPLQGYTPLSDPALDSLLRELKSSHPNDGEVMLAAHIRARGIHIPRSRLRASIHRVDSLTGNRRPPRIRRRAYHVDAPNSVWHFDGNHKLIRWRFVVHGAVDGYSRVVLYLRCETNNRASSVLSAFSRAVDTYGVPDRVRSDLGGENVDVWRYMYEQHSNDPSCVIVGSSTHNERIERLWRDVHRCVLQPFAETFRTLESDGVLDPLNEVDLFCLHYCFLERINKCLTSFQEAWNHHTLSSVRNATPYQLYLAGFIAAEQSPQLPDSSSYLQQVQQVFPQPADHVVVPRSLFHPCNRLMLILQGTFNPLTPEMFFETRMYVDGVHVIAQHLLANCSDCSEI